MLIVEMAREEIDIGNNPPISHRNIATSVFIHVGFIAGLVLAMLTGLALS